MKPGFTPKYMVNFDLKRLDLAVFAVIIISVLSLYQVHFNYTGKFSMANDRLFEYHQAKNMTYIYPYFSDEWYAVALSKNPLKNPFNGQFFTNPELASHSFLAAITAVFGLNLLASYTALSIIFNTLLIVLAYFFMRRCNLPKIISAISALSILYITSASNLPGIWNLIPVTFGIIFSLAGFCFMPDVSQNMPARFVLPTRLFARSARSGSPHPNPAARKHILLGPILAGILVFLFYPPLIVFYGLGILVYFLDKQRLKINLIKILKYFIIFLSIFAVLAIVLMLSPAAKPIRYVFSNLFYDSFTGDFVPYFNPVYIIPLWAIIFAFLGLKTAFKQKKWLVSQIVLGVIFWLIYSFSTLRFIIGFERVVYFTSILVVLIAAFGMNEAIKRLPGLKYAGYAALILFLLFVPFYTQSENWRKLVLRNSKIQADSIPMAPANNYLTSEDLRIFKNIKQKKFFSIPWKGTVIGIATGNYPVLTKGGTITMGAENPIIYQQFMEADCAKKAQIAKEREVEYVYSMPFDCPKFEEIDQSTEGFVLYKLK